jgi:hypothetical protein
MKYFLLSLAIVLAGCDASSHTQVLTYEQLIQYPVSCDKKDSQLKELKHIQRVKNFDPDPDNLSDMDRAYNSRLKSTIWWYTYRCEQ